MSWFVCISQKMLNYVQTEKEPKTEANLSNICLFESENGDGGGEQKCNQEGKYLIAGPLLVVFHHRQTGWFAVWENSKQNLGRENIVPESRLPFVLISSITEKRPQRPETCIMALKKWNTNFRLEHSVPCRYSRCMLPEIFRRNDPKSPVSFTFQPDLTDFFYQW